MWIYTIIHGSRPYIWAEESHITKVECTQVYTVSIWDGHHCVQSESCIIWAASHHLSWAYMFRNTLCDFIYYDNYSVFTQKKNSNLCDVSLEYTLPKEGVSHKAHNGQNLFASMPFPGTLSYTTRHIDWKLLKAWFGRHPSEGRDLT